MSSAPGGLRKIISGGQTGADLGALQAAADAGLNTGGWCPPDHRNEAGEIAVDFGLRRTPGERSGMAPDLPRSLRTEWNVRDSDATLILSPGDNKVTDPGTVFTKVCAARYGRPLLCVDPAAPGAAACIAEWLRDTGIRTLNVAGPSEATSPGIGHQTRRMLTAVIRS